MTDRELFNTAYAQTQRAAELLSVVGDQRALTRLDANTLAQWLQEAGCAARELANRANGTRPPKRGD